MPPVNRLSGSESAWYPPTCLVVGLSTTLRNWTPELPVWESHLNFKRSSKFAYFSGCSRESIQVRSDWTLPPRSPVSTQSIAPSFTDQKLGSASQPVRSLPLNIAMKPSASDLGSSIVFP